MGRFFGLWRAIRYVVPLALWCAFSGGPTLAQERMDDVVILKSGREIVGFAAVDSVNKVVRVRTPRGKLIEVSLDSVQTFSQIERVRESPLRPIRYFTIEQEIPWTCGRVLPWYFLELRAVGIKGETFTFGGEVTAGFRLWAVSIGAGIARLQLLSKWRTPVFLHCKYHFSEGCLKPFVMLDAGFVYDTFTDKYGIKPSLRATTERYSKMAGFGAGLDFALTKLMDLSVDAGYRYFTLAEDREAASCSQDVIVCGYSELHTAYLRVGVTF